MIRSWLSFYGRVRQTDKKEFYTARTIDFNSYNGCINSLYSRAIDFYQHSFYFFFLRALSAAFAAFSFSLSCSMSCFTLSINAFPLMSLATTRLLGAIRRLAGRRVMPCCLTMELSQPLKSHTCFHRVVSLSQAFNHSFLSKSSDRLTMRNFSFSMPSVR